MIRTKHPLPSRVKIGKKYVGEGEPVFFIAEVGNNHNGDYYLAKKTVEEAVKAGADAVKLQKRFVDEVFAKELLEKPQTKDQIYGKTYGEYRKNLELGMDDFKKLKKIAEGLGALFFATPFDKKSVDFLEGIGADVYKIASFDVTNLPLLDYVARLKKPIILSSGLSTQEELDEAVDAILGYHDKLVVLHCVSVYPTPDDKINIATLKMIKDRYAPLPVGYSGHENDILPTIAAIANGARVVERHITLDRSMPGPDHGTVSIEPEDFRQMVEYARRVEKMFGGGIKEVLEDEAPTRNKHTKSIVSKVKIPKGKKITASMLTVKSPGYGLKPKMLKDVIGKKTKVSVPADTVLKEEDVVWK